MTWFKVTTSTPPRPYEKKPAVRLSARGACLNLKADTLIWMDFGAQN